MIFRQLFDEESCTYTYLIGSEYSKHAVLIDPVLNHVGRYIALINKYQLHLVASIDSHLHADHITASGSLTETTRCISMMGRETKAEHIRMKFKDQDELKFGDLKLKAIYTPGHTDDSYCFLMNKALFTGDTLFIGGTGRTDFQNGSASQQYDSLFNGILKLPEHTLVYPGHDYKGNKVSTIGKELKTNPRLQVKSKEEYIHMMENLNLAPPKRIHVALPANLKNGLVGAETYI
ncbi:MBL fold metallo-hydrolase [Legionella israelensis]|uniref:MBL fold metallo-hydrolase n=1 Tax=Legionella israelensis TaxID=454 RepID=UPI00117C696C|nr:MBL fold metallo-hydrolase [Legionella israelensis]QDP71940.1 MBL fold metallo-hydrolase [Legionella israelensis]